MAANRAGHGPRSWENWVHEDARAKPPAAERAAWQQLWADVQALLQ